MGMNIRDGLDDDMEETHDINVTPFIDVILVLLIIFMVAAPLATVDVKVELPRSNAAAQPLPEKPVFVTLERDLSVSIGNASLAGEAFLAELEKATGGDRETRIYLRADRSVAYGDLMNLMNALRDAQYLKVALVGIESGGEAP